MVYSFWFQIFLHVYAIVLTNMVFMLYIAQHEVYLFKFGTRFVTETSHFSSSLKCWQGWDFSMNCFILVHYIGGSLLVKWWTHDRKVASLNKGRNSGRIFFSRVNFVCSTLFGVCSNPKSLHLHIKDPGHSAKSVGGRLHLTCIYPWLNEVGGGWLWSCPGRVWEPIQIWAHTELVGELSATVISGHWATVDWSWPKDCN